MQGSPDVKRWKRWTRYRQKMFDQGRCTNCGQLLKEEEKRKFKRCTQCREKAVTRSTSNRKKNVEAGRCYRCGGVLTPEEKAAGIRNHSWSNCYPSRNGRKL